ncbi:MAG: anaerobic ribonucleoside-triphosphate reductase [Victivallales bacterium]
MEQGKEENVTKKESTTMAKCGMKTEIFSRVCGYHRPIKNWNKGKQEEFKDRKAYSTEIKKKEKVA